MKPGISLALDGLGIDKIRQLLTALASRVLAVKIHDLLDRHGPPVIGELCSLGAPKVWVDYKLHDTRDTVALRVKALVESGAKIITVHASGGIPMMQAAVKATLSPTGEPLAEIYAITLLTSLDEAEIGRIYGKERTREEIVHELALMAKEAGVRTIVCSAQEVQRIKRSAALEGMQATVPGTRSAGVALGQQKRSATPAQAVVDGADELVAGSQVTQAADPVLAFDAMAVEVESVNP